MGASKARIQEKRSDPCDYEDLDPEKYYSTEHWERLRLALGIKPEKTIDMTTPHEKACWALAGIMTSFCADEGDEVEDEG